MANDGGARLIRNRANGTDRVRVVVACHELGRRPGEGRDHEARDGHGDLARACAAARAAPAGKARAGVGHGRQGDGRVVRV